MSDSTVLAGKHIVFLGSSVTYGSAAGGISFADLIGERNRCAVTKEAVSGTTLVDESPDSYVSRMLKLDRTVPVDLFVCQLSTNDATQKKTLGTVGPSEDPDTFETRTVAGAMEYIIAYAKATWHCPVVFYTNPKYESPCYENMVDLLHAISAKWEIGVINMWNDKDFQDIPEEKKKKYMADPIHPTKLGYLEWWTPYFERELSRILKNSWLLA